VFWDIHDLPLEDVERIEVISGPGSTVWGSNAVSGVINVVTRHAATTQGGMLNLQPGDPADAHVARWGGTLRTGHYRVWAKHAAADATQNMLGMRQRDAWHRNLAGFRADWNDAAQDLSVRANVYSGHFEQLLPGTRRAWGGSVDFDWQRHLADGGRFVLQGAVDHRSREHPGTFEHRNNIAELEWQYLPATAGRHELVYGGNYRVSWDRVGNSARLQFLPERRRLHWLGAYVEDAFAIGDEWRAIAGLRLEHNAYTGLEWMPQLRLAWSPEPERVVWTAVSRSVRTPSRIDRDFFIDEPVPISGGGEFQSEIARTVEVGYRHQRNSDWRVSVTVFFNDYLRLRSLERRADGRYVIANTSEGESSGLEAWGRWRASDSWLLMAGYTFLDQRLRLAQGSTDPLGVGAQSNDPRHSIMLRSSWEPTPHYTLDLQWRVLSERPAPHVPGYGVVDSRFAWRPRPGLELSLGVDNLFDHTHAEFGVAPQRSVLGRSVHVGLRWDF